MLALHGRGLGSKLWVAALGMSWLKIFENLTSSKILLLPLGSFGDFTGILERPLTHIVATSPM